MKAGLQMEEYAPVGPFIQHKFPKSEQPQKLKRKLNGVIRF